MKWLETGSLETQLGAAAASPTAVGQTPPPAPARGRRAGNSHRAKANFPGKLLGFLQALVTEIAAKSASCWGPSQAGAAARVPGVLPERSRAEVQNSRPAQARLPAPPGTLGQLPLSRPSPPAPSNGAPPARTSRLAAGISLGRL